MRHPFAGMRDARHRHAVDLAADLDGFLFGLRARRDAHRNLVGLRPIRRRHPAMDRIHAEEIDAQVVGLQVHDLESFLKDPLRKLRAPQRAGPGVEEHVLADVTLGAADRHL